MTIRCAEQVYAFAVTYLRTEPMIVLVCGDVVPVPTVYKDGYAQVFPTFHQVPL